MYELLLECSYREYWIIRQNSMTVGIYIYE